MKLATCLLPILFSLISCGPQSLKEPTDASAPRKSTQSSKKPIDTPTPGKFIQSLKKTIDASTLQEYDQWKGTIELPLPYVYDYYEDQGYRLDMQDKHVICTTENYMIAAVFDGHGGSSQTAVWLAKELPKRLVQELNNLGTKATIDQQKEAIIQLYEKLDKEIFDGQKNRQWSDKSGSTAVVYLAIKYPNEKPREMLINLGDSRAIVIRDNGVIAETKDHKPNNKTEKARIRKNNGNVVEQEGTMRVRPGGLAVSRAFGDPGSKLKNKKYFSGWISATPDVYEVSTEPGDYVVLASDGLWDEMDSEKVANFITEKSCQHIAKELAQEVQSKPKPVFGQKASDTVRFLSGSTEDNISIIVLHVAEDK